MFNAGVRGKRAKDGTGFTSSTEQFVQQTYLIPTVTSFSVTDVSYVPLDNTAVDTAGGETIVINGSGFAPGATVQVGATTIGSVTFIDQNRLAFSAPVLSSGSYTIYVTNSNGGTGILLSGLVYSGLPTYTTTAGTLGTIYETANINTAVVATGDAPITYSVISGTLPSGATLNSNGTITGNAPADGSSTTYSFTIQASDAQLQDSTRAFTLTINTDVLTWGLANNTMYLLDGGTAMSNVTLSATSAANSNSAVTFAANTLPTGVSISGNTVFGTPTTEQTVYSTLTATATQTGRTATRFVTWVVTIADLFFDYTTLLIPGANTTFVDDASTNNFAVTINGDTKPNNTNPYTPGYYSNYFDGSGDRLVVPANAAFNFGTGDFTVECWVNLNSVSANQWIIGPDNTVTYPWVLQTIGTAIRFISNNAANDFRPTSFTLTTGTWNHFAVTRSGSTMYWFTNGTLNGTQTYSTAIGSNTIDVQIGTTGSGSGDPVNGYISNLRVVKGTAVYTSSFTPSATPLTAITNTSLLTCQSNRFIDNSTNNFTITVAGNTTINSFDPFVPNSSYSTYGSAYIPSAGSTYINAGGNTALALGSGNFTFECWLYLNSLAPSYTTLFDWRTNGSAGSGIPVITDFANNGTLAFAIGNGSSFATPVVSSSTIPINRWFHLALVRNGSTITMYFNGVSVGSGTNSSTLGVETFNIGSPQVANYNAPMYVTDVRIVKGTAVYTTAFTPPSEPLTAIANTSLLTLQNNQPVNNKVFLDNSSVNSLITRSGNTTQGTFSPYGGNWSNYFDGTGDNLSLATATALGTGNTTVEFWFYPTDSSATYRAIYDGRSTVNTDTGYAIFQYGLTIEVYGNGLKVATSASAFTVNNWVYVALVRTSGTCQLYINGVASGSSGTYSANLTSTVRKIGDSVNTLFPFVGYISNLREVTSALYSGTFTPSTSPLTPITNTVLLTCQSNRLIDNSINNFTITKNGDVSVQRFSPFNPSSLTPTSYSGYFDGTGDYLNTPSNAAFALGTGDFTMECWIYVTAAFGTTGSGRGAIISNRTAASGNTSFVLQHYNGKIYFGTVSTDVWPAGGNTTMSINTWYHVAVTRSSGTVRLFLNGVSDATAVTGDTTNFSDTSATYIGCDGSYGGPLYQYTGYISNVRIVKGTAVYTSAFTPLTSPLTAIANTSLLTCQSPTFIDNSTNNFTITAFGNSQPRQQNPFGSTSALTEGYTVSTIGGSGYFDGTGDYLTIPDSTVLEPGSNNFTLDCWYYMNNDTGYLIGKRNPASANYGIFQIAVYPTGGSILGVLQGGSPWNLSLNFTATTPLYTWNHLAFVRSGNVYTVYINGVNSGTTTLAGALNNSNYNWVVGAYQSDGTGAFNGYISDMRLVIGTAVYTSNFVPPAQPLTAIQNTVLLNNMTSAGIYDATMMNNLETLGDAKLSTAVSKFGGSSMAFDGTGDYLYSAPNINQVMSSGDFTIELWYYPITHTNDFPAVIGNYNATWTANKWILHAPQTLNKYGFWVNNYSAVASMLTSTSNVTDGAWVHIAITRSGNTWRMFINGIVESTVTSSVALDGGTVASIEGLYIGANFYAGGGGRYINAYIDDLRITKGIARYTANFTAPLSAFKTK